MPQTVSENTLVNESWSVIEWTVSPWFPERDPVAILNGWPRPANANAADTWVRSSEREAVEWAARMAQSRPGKCYVVVKILGYACVRP